MRLQGKRALVTGGAAGIGLAIVQRFLEEGGTLAFCDLNVEASRTAIAGLASHRQKVCAITGDVSNSAGAQKIVSEAVAFLGGIDILVNNAGVDLQRDMMSTTDEEWDKVLRVNAGGVFYMSRAAVPE